MTSYRALVAGDEVRLAAVRVDELKAVQETAFRSAVAAVIDDELVHCAVPALAAESLGGSSAAAMPWPRTRSIIGVAKAGPRVHALADGNLLLATTENQRRVLRPLLSSSTTWSPTPSGLDQTKTYYSRSRRVPRLVEAIVAAARQGGLLLNQRWVEDRLLASARALTRVETLPWTLVSGCLVVASQHDIVSRAAVREARVRGVPSVYVPHAPVADVPWYRDLPTDYASVRGLGEKDFYIAHGADAARLHVSGNPGADLRTPPVIRPFEPPVFAVSPVAPDKLRALAAVVGAAGGEWVVAPHPRSDLRLLRQMLGNGILRLSRAETTLDLLCQGPPLVVQSSSGVAAEALALGLPTVQLGFPGERAPYPIIERAAVEHVFDSVQLRAAVAQAKSLYSCAKERDRLRRAAAYWCASSGPDAVKAVRDALALATTDGPRRTGVMDGWRPR